MEETNKQTNNQIKNSTLNTSFSKDKKIKCKSLNMKQPADVQL